MSPTQIKYRTGSAFDTGDDSIILPRQLLAIDPGTRHCGMALMVQPTITDDWGLVETWDRKPIDCTGYLHTWLQEAMARQWCVHVVVEGYQLYPDKMQQQGLSRMGTPEVIGALKWIYCQFRYAGGLGRFNEQGASIKGPGRRYMDEQGIEETGSNTHKRDAEAHAWYRIKVLRAEQAKLARARH